MDDLEYNLRKICGHDSFSVDGCHICEAIDLIDRLQVELGIKEAVDEYLEEIGGRLTVEKKKLLVKTLYEILDEDTKSKSKENIGEES